MSHYIDKMQFHKELKEYQKTQSQRAYEKIGKNFLLLAKNTLNKPSFINYTNDRKDDMISEALYDMIRYMHNYDVERGDKLIDDGKTPEPFSYFTSYAYNGINRCINARKKDETLFVRLPFIENLDQRDANE